MKGKESRFALATLAALAVVPIASAQTAPTLHFYLMGNTQVGSSQTAAIAEHFGFTQEMAPTGAPLPIWGMADGSVRQEYLGGNLQVIPDLTKRTGAGPTTAAALRFTQDFVSQFGLQPNDASKWTTGEFISWSREDGSVKFAGTAVTPIVGVRFQRMLDNLPVYGPNSVISGECDIHGLIGLLFNVRPANVVSLPAVQKKPDQIEAEFRMRLTTDVLQNPGSAKLISKTLCYLDQGVSYIQPAYRYRVEITGNKGETSGEEIFVPVASNSPEPVYFGRFNGFDPIIPENAPTAVGGADVTTIKLGEYVVRNDADQGICLNIANNFNALSHAAGALIGHNVNRTQYFWDVQWLWETALGINDQSRFYPGAVDFAVVVAHGAPWEFSSLSNYGEWVDLHNMDSYGQNSPSGNPSHDFTSYMLFTACSMMPAPGDAHGGDYTTGGPFDVYWNIFHGMHGLYGYRSTAGKQDCVNSFSSLAYAGGAGASLVAAWMNATGGLDHSNGWNYATAVLPTGRESDNMYNITALPAATSLSMWWNHA
jgi:hypothetical protein